MVKMLRIKGHLQGEAVAAKPKTRVVTLVTTVKIKIQIKNIRYLDTKNFPLDIGTVSIAFKVCSLYSLPNR